MRGATYRIKVRNPRHVSSGVTSVKVDGKTIDGNRLPIAPAGAAVKVDLTLG